MINDKQKIGFWSLTSLVTGNLIGSGVFLLPATLAHYGSMSILAWIITALGAITLSIIFAELGHKISKSGGPYAFVSAAFGKNLGFIVAWGYWTLSWISNSALVASAAGYLSIITGELSKFVILGIEISILMLITIFNLFGLKTTGKGELIITVAKIIPLTLIPLIGIFMINYDFFPPFNITNQPALTALNSVAFITIWGFIGLETGTVPSGQVINSRRTVPLATITGTLIASFIYILGTIVTFGVIENHHLVNSNAPYAEAATIIFGGKWSIAVAIAAIITCIGSLNGWTIVIGRIAYSASKDKLFPEIFSRINNEGSPVWAIVVSSILTIPFIILSLSGTLIEQFNLVIDVSVTFILFIYLMSTLAFLKLTYRDKSIIKLTLGLLGLAFVVWALLATKPIMLFYSLLMVLTGMPVLIYQKYKKRF